MVSESLAHMDTHIAAGGRVFGFFCGTIMPQLAKASRAFQLGESIRFFSTSVKCYHIILIS